MPIEPRYYTEGGKIVVAEAISNLFTVLTSSMMTSEVDVPTDVVWYMQKQSGAAIYLHRLSHQDEDWTYDITDYLVMGIDQSHNVYLEDIDGNLLILSKSGTATTVTWSSIETAIRAALAYTPTTDTLSHRRQPEYPTTETPHYFWKHTVSHEGFVNLVEFLYQDATGSGPYPKYTGSEGFIYKVNGSGTITVQSIWKDIDVYTSSSAFTSDNSNYVASDTTTVAGKSTNVCCTRNRIVIMDEWTDPNTAVVSRRARTYNTSDLSFDHELTFSNSDPTPRFYCRPYSNGYYMVSLWAIPSTFLEPVEEQMVDQDGVDVLPAWLSGVQNPDDGAFSLQHIHTTTSGTLWQVWQPVFSATTQTNRWGFYDKNGTRQHGWKSITAGGDIGWGGYVHQYDQFFVIHVDASSTGNDGLIWYHDYQYANHFAELSRASGFTESVQKFLRPSHLAEIA